MIIGDTPNDIPHFGKADMDNRGEDLWTSGPLDLWNGWRKATASGSGSGCVEIRSHQDGTRQVRDSKNPGSPPMTFTAFEWNCFLDGARNGEFDD